MIHYHGLPITPAQAAVQTIKGRHAFVSFAHKDQLPLAAELCQSFALDNGAFSAWRSGRPITDWRPFFEWASEVSLTPHCDFVVIPDVIDGSVAAQEDLMGAFLDHFGPRGRFIGAPVYHMHEPLEHAAQLASEWPRLCLGSSGQWATVGGPDWRARMADIMAAVCDPFGRPLCKLHGLRMLNPKVFTQYPFASADSTNVGQNVGIDQKWKGTYLPPSKGIRGLVLAERIEAHNAPSIFEPCAYGDLV